MTERIDLTDEEAEKLGDYLYETDGLGWTELARGLVERLNELREPDPIRTVRVDADGSVAIKLNDHVSDQWWVHRFDARCGGYASFEYVSDWPIAYRPATE